MRLINFHADTPSRICEGLSFDDPGLQAGSYSHLPYRASLEVYALFTPVSESDHEAWHSLFRRAARFRAAVACASLPCPRCILSLEDARLLEGELSRVKILHTLGIRIITPLWRGVSSVGGAYDTDIGLTQFGKEMIRECIRNTIVPDISHASRRSAEEILSIAEEMHFPVIASHSAFASVAPHPRNLEAPLFERVVASGGIVGVCLMPDHLACREEAGIEEIVRHIEYGLCRAPHAIAFGTDFDGIPRTPRGVGSTASLLRIAERLSARGHTDKTIRALFYGNGMRFLTRIFK